MSESPEHTTETTPVVTTAQSTPNRLYRAAAWVGIVAGTVFIVAVIFFSGVILGRHSGGPGCGGRHGENGMMMERQGPGMHRHGEGWKGWPGGPGMMRPGDPDQGGPGNFGPGGPRPSGVPPAPPSR